jgi:hypothetical protein
MTPDGTLSGMIGGANRVATPSQVLLPDTRARIRSCSSRVGGLSQRMVTISGVSWQFKSGFRANRLARKLLVFGEPVGIRTRDLLIKSQLLYRLSYGLYVATSILYKILSMLIFLLATN